MSARLTVLDRWPYAASAILSLIPRRSEIVPIAGVDKHWRLYYHPTNFPALSEAERAAVIAHECGHVMFAHHARSKAIFGETTSARNLYIWNLATDCAINCLVKKSRFELPADCVWPSIWGFPEDLSADEYLDLFLSMDNPPEPPQWFIDGLPQPADSTPKLIGGGSIGDGQPKPWEEGEPTAYAPGVDKSAQEAALKQTAKKLKQHGHGHAMLERWADEITTCKVNPRVILSRFIRHVGAVERGGDHRSYRRLSRRSRPDLCLPSDWQPLYPKMTQILDTSGSMGPEDLAKGLSFVDATIRSFELDGIEVVCGDTAIATQAVVKSAAQVELAGGGGTEMDTLIRLVAERTENRPDMIVVITDAATDWPSEPIDIPVAAVIVTDRYSDYIERVPDWIKKVVLD